MPDLRLVFLQSALNGVNFTDFACHGMSVHRAAYLVGAFPVIPLLHIGATIFCSPKARRLPPGDPDCHCSCFSLFA
jgi:hypothetical protein